MWRLKPLHIMLNENLFFVNIWFMSFTISKCAQSNFSKSFFFTLGPYNLLFGIRIFQQDSVYLSFYNFLGFQGVAITSFGNQRIHVNILLQIKSEWLMYNKWECHNLTWKDYFDDYAPHFKHTAKMPIFVYCMKTNLVIL